MSNPIELPSELVRTYQCLADENTIGFIGIKFATG